MAWLFAIVVLILLIVSASFRKFSGVLLLLAAVGGGGYYLYDQHQERLANSRITAAQVRVTNTKILSEYGSYRFRGRVTNTSPQHTLSQVDFEIAVSECPQPPAASPCVVVAETRETLYIKVPPGQARDFNEYLYFAGDSLAPAPDHRWRFDVVAVRASEPDA
ncbi:hypothetical protein ABQF08_16775 [Xanthomonas campestris pv. campestris]|jgi:hypothetical protein|uniref:hypothetical protein n=1 Tax=Xanthomonas campestris TaxID=339 RepID=UPI000370F672|nr:hypothetical protein [Xanthomonas campestris]AKS14758.1 hypothetical protein AEA00_01690 [Xanthomonas campestris pv. campestris]AKS18776.1 hypothetical protein AEA01_01665 [Xanthomonas campestris pv. campestris]ALE67305.1 hypothetical protein AAW18_01645 [Xanthomonas campestris pv. campestris]MBD8249387.1 hypothetical protein [Xanthomonas campestris]MCC5054073.1 hypothetical protein [Xanthomonas campestris pv. aberrans]